MEINDQEQEIEKQVQELKSKRVEACNKELAELLEKHKCNLVGHQELVNGQPQPLRIVVVPR